jgi:hypothetical protein
MTQFVQRSYDGAYSVFWAHDDASASWVCVLAAIASKTGDALSLADAWALATPWALIVRESEWDFASESPSTAANALGLPGLTGNALVLAWRADQSDSAKAAWWWPPSPGVAAPEYQIVKCPAAGGNRQTTTATIAMGNVQLIVPDGATVTLGGDGSSLHIARTGSQFSIGRADVRIGLSTYDVADLLTSAAGGVTAGGLRTTGVSWPPKNVFLLGQDSNQIRLNAVDPPEVRYWWSQGASLRQRLRLPLFAQVDITAPRIGVDFALNPALPFDPAASRFDLSAATQGVFASARGLTTVDGSGVGLTPVSGTGFHLAPGFVAGQNRVYLAPYGRFSLVAPQSANGTFRLMPGLSGLEYIDASGGDLLDLVPGNAAFGSPAAPDGSQPPRLTSLCTTSWMRLTPAASTRPYYAQPLSSVFYASADGTSLPRAADAKVSDLTGAEQPYPLAPYANIFLQSAIPQPPADQMTAFEHTFLAGTRGATLGSGNQPVFSIGGKVLTQVGATPRGLFAEIGPVPPAGSAPRSSAATTPAGQWRRLYLAKGVAQVVTLEPTAGGVVDPTIGNAFLQPDLFLVYNNWTGKPIGVSGELDVGGFSFDWAPLDGKDPSTLLVAKFSSKISLTDLFALPQRWRNADTLVTDIAAAQGVFAVALKVAEDSRKAGLALFDDFLDRIAGDPAWTGLVVFQAPVDGNAMPPTLQILIAGMNQPLRAHHIAVDVTALASQNGVPQDVGPSSVAGVISYDDPRGTTSGDPPPPPPPSADPYGFYTQSLKVGIFGSAVTSFNAEVGITANVLFGRGVALRYADGDPNIANTFLLKGIYHVIATVPTVTFQVPEARVFDFVVDPGAGGGTLARVLERFEIDSAGIMPQGTTDKGGGVTAHQTQITLSGQLWFAADPFDAPVDLFSYGLENGAGLALNNFGLEMTFDLDAQGQRVGAPTFVVDYSRLAVADTYRSLRPGGMVGGLPFKLKGILADDDGLDVAKLGGKPVQVLQIAASQIRQPHFALQFELIIGSLGELSGVHAGLTAEMRLGWGPLDTTPDADGALVTIQLPGASGGFGSLNVQGFLQLVFGEANLLQVQYTPKSGPPVPVYAILFNNVALSVMGIKLPPKVISDLILFSDPANATGSNLAACLAVRQQ